MNNINFTDILAISIWAYCVIYPIYCYLTIAEEKRLVAESGQHRIEVYRSTIINLWLPIIPLALYLYLTNTPLVSIGLNWQWTINQIIGILAIVAIVIYLWRSLKPQNFADPEQISQLEQQMAHVAWMMPSDKKQTKLFCGGVSVSAGICEELIFRGFMLYQLTQVMPTYLAVIVSSLLFGLAHWYQGAIHIIRTALLGAVMAGCYLATDTLIIPILLHVIIDVYGGQLGYLFNQIKQKANHQPPAFAQSK